MSRTPQNQTLLQTRLVSLISFNKLLKTKPALFREGDIWQFQEIIMSSSKGIFEQRTSTWVADPLNLRYYINTSRRVRGPAATQASQPEEGPFAFLYALTLQN